MVDGKLDKLENEIEKDLDKKEVTKKDLLYLIANTREKGKLFQNKFKEHASTAIIAAFSFLIALSWKDLIVKLVDNYLKPGVLQNYPYLNDLLTAFIVTGVSVIAIVFVSKWSGKEDKKTKK